MKKLTKRDVQDGRRLFEKRKAELGKVAGLIRKGDPRAPAAIERSFLRGQLLWVWTLDNIEALLALAEKEVEGKDA